MKPEQRKEYVDIWVLVHLGVGISQTKPHTVLTHQEIFYSLHEAQQAQTFEALKSGYKYEVFHLEFPL